MYAYSEQNNQGGTGYNNEQVGKYRYRGGVTCCDERRPSRCPAYAEYRRCAEGGCPIAGSRGRRQGLNPLADVWPFYHTGTIFLPQFSDASLALSG